MPPMLINGDRMIGVFNDGAEIRIMKLVELHFESLQDIKRNTKRPHRIPYPTRAEVALANQITQVGLNRQLGD